MPASSKRKRRFRRRIKVKASREKPSSKNFLVITLTLIVLIQTVLLLSFIPKDSPSKAYKKIESRKVPSKTPVTKKRDIKPLAKIDAAFQKPYQARPGEIKGKIAIVIDDWGYSKINLPLLQEIDSPLTLAILPFKDYSKKISEFGYKNDFEVIIHMPMEPKDKDKAALEPQTLMTYMGKATINSILNNAFSNVKYAKGINNHMGSLATQNKKFLSTVFKELKKRNIYFLDSYVIADSVARDVSKEIGIKFAKRSVFLDNESDPRKIRDQLYLLAKEAEKNGKAIGIGHDRKNTLLILKQEIPILTRQGFKFVYVSELVD